MKLSPFFLQALSRSGVQALPAAKRFVFGDQIAAELISTSSSVETLELEDLEIRFANSALVSFSLHARAKPLVRFDFTNEWNNLGYGRVGLKRPWGLSVGAVLIRGEKVASVHDRRTGEIVCDYIVRFTHEGVETLWINRDVGPVDGYDWSIVERFLAEPSAGQANVLPLLDEIPYGFDGAYTMRIDCDEAIASGRRLFELYKSFASPFSIAVKTQQPIGEADIAFMSDLIEAGGSVVGHSHTHAPNWGGGGAATVREVEESRRVLRETGVVGINFDYMVSPFHQNSVEAVQGLRDAGVKGFVSGIICNDPEFLMARSGQVPLVDGIISHSQQCMFHGDTVHVDPTLSVYFRAFRQALETRTFFGFLDHPFSNYQYGWSSEVERLEAHARFLDVLTKTPNLWRANLVDAMKFLDLRSKARIRREGDQWVASLPKFEGSENLPSVAVRYGTQSIKLTPGEEVKF